MTERTILNLRITEETLELGGVLFHLYSSANCKTTLADVDRAHTILSEYLTTLRWSQNLSMPKAAEPFPEPSR
jgi:hypothetical protein